MGNDKLGYVEFKENFFDNLKLNPFIEDSFIALNEDKFDSVIPDLYMRYSSDANFSIYNSAYSVAVFITYFL